MREKTVKNPHALKITQQAHVRTAMVFDLSADEHRLTLSTYGRENADDVADFRIEARPSRAPDAPVVTGWGSTRLEALAEVGKSWRERADAEGLHPFDWEAIATLLATVRGV